MGTPTTQVLRWRTDVPSDSRVRLGTSPASLVPVAGDAIPTTEHAVTVTGLAPNTVYYYSVGTTAGSLRGGDLDHFFVTPPPSGTSDAVRVWVLGDAGTAGPSGANADQAAVRDAYAAWNKQYTDLILMLGDNAYYGGTDGEYQNAVFNMYRSILRQTNLWTTIGNHDTDQWIDPDIATTPYFNLFTLPTKGEAGGLASGTEKYYSFDFANIHFVSLDSMTSDRSVNGPMVTWLGKDLAANRQRWIIAFWHHPPYSKGGHDSDTESQLIEMRANVLPILEAYGVDLVLSGHSHSYERSKLIGGYFGPSSTLTKDMIKDGGSGRLSGTGAYAKVAGTNRAVYVVAGSAGQFDGGPLDHPAMFISLNQLGSMVLDVNGDRLDAAFLRDDGVVADSFTIVKTPANVPPTVHIKAPASGTCFDVPADLAIAADAKDSDGAVAKVEFFKGTTLLGTATSAPYTFTWKGAVPGTYQLTAKATDNAGTVTISSPVTVTVAANVPAAPSALVATAVAKSRIDLAWTDNSGNETGFRIERSTDRRRFAQIATVGADVTHYSSTGLAADKTYFYRVRATNANGDSAYSNIANPGVPRR